MICNKTIDLITVNLLMTVDYKSGTDNTNEQQL